MFALARPLIRLDADGSSDRAANPRLAFVELYLLLFAGMGYALSSYRDIVLGQARYEALPGHRAGDRRLPRRGAGGDCAPSRWPAC